VSAGAAPLVRTAAALMTSTVAASAFGFVFWVAAARWFPAEAVGTVSAAVSALTLLAAIAQLNLTSMFARFVPGAGHRTRRLVLGGFGASAAMGVLLAAGFLAVGPRLDALDGLGWDAVFVVAVVAASLLFIQDAVLAALGRAGSVPVKNTVAAAGRLALLPVFAALGGGPGLLLAWVLPGLATMLLINWWILTRLARRRREAPQPVADAGTGRGREVTSFVAAEYVNGVITNMISFLPPVLVSAVLGPAQGAYFYLPWTIGVGITTLLWNVVTSFVVSASAGAAEARAHVRRAGALVLAVVVPATAVLTLAARPLLSVVGPEYAANGAGLLRVIGLSVPFTAVVLMVTAFAVMEKRMWRMVAVQAVLAAVCLGGGWLALVRAQSAMGPAWSLVIAQAAMALVLLPGLVRRIRSVGTASWAGTADSQRRVPAPRHTTEEVAA